MKTRTISIIIVVLTTLLPAAFYVLAADEVLPAQTLIAGNDSDGLKHPLGKNSGEPALSSAPDLSEDISPLDFMTEEEIKNIQKEGLQILEQTPAVSQKQLDRESYHKPTPFTAITENFEGKSIQFPSTMFYDKSMEETYVPGSEGITVFGPDYFPRFVIGPGRGLDATISGAVGKDGLVYILQAENQSTHKGPRLTVLNGAFFLENEISFNDYPEMANFKPRRIALRGNGEIYLAEFSGKRGVLVLDQKLRFKRWLRTYDEKGGIIPINEVDITEDGRIFLLSEKICRIFVYSPEEQLLRSFGELGGVTGKMSRPQGMALDEVAEKLFVADYMRHTVLTFSFNGDYLFEIGGRGWALGWFNFPSDVAMGQKNFLLIADTFNNRIQVMKND